MTRGHRIAALAVAAIAVLGVVFTSIAGNRPLLGLDLQGGVSVVLEPTSSTDGEGSGREVTEEALDLTVELLRSRIDSIGVAEPEISRQGSDIVVALPGLVQDQAEALDRLRQTAELRFRPVLLNLGPGLTLDDLEIDDEGEGGDAEVSETGDADTGTGNDADPTDTDAETIDADAEEESMAGGGRFAPVLAAQDSEDDDATETGSSDADSSDGASSTGTDSGTGADSDGTDSDGAESTGADSDGAESTGTDSDGVESTGADSDGAGDDLAETFDPAAFGIPPECLAGEVTTDTDDHIDEVVILTDRDGLRYCLGPAVYDDQLLTGDMVETAEVGLNPGFGWQVNPTFRPGTDGIDKFNTIANVCYIDNLGNQPHPEAQTVCPTSQLAVVLDHEVISAPRINAPRFARDQITISGDFTEEEARRLAESLRFGSLPLELVAQETRTVSASIGSDVLRSGVIAGLIGLSLVAVYLLAYYRLAGLVAIGGLLLSGALLWTIVAWFGAQFGLALTLAGVVGLIVAIGVSADSNIVYFENVKDSYRSGRRVPTAIERAYETAISTIVKADVVSLIAAVLLYLLTVGAVRGFAFYLGLATLLDLLISWLFMRPALGWLARRSAVQTNPRLLGLPGDRGPGADQSTMAQAASTGGVS